MRKKVQLALNKHNFGLDDEEDDEARKNREEAEKTKKRWADIIARYIPKIALIGQY
jgi:hypothetical protein